MFILSTTVQSVRSRTMFVFGLLTSAVAGVVIVFFVAKATGANLKVTPEFSSSAPKDLPLEEAIAATLALSILGVFLAWGIGKFLPHPKIIFLVGAIIGMIGYGALAFAKADAIGDALWLNAMHFAAAIPLVGGLLSQRIDYFS